MKICVSSTGTDIKCEVDQRFGRCPYFIVLNTETMEYGAVENDNMSAGGGAGIASAKNVIDTGAKAILTGNCGPNAVKTLNAGGIQIYTGLKGTVEQVVEDFKAGRLKASTEANVESHFGSI